MPASVAESQASTRKSGQKYIVRKFNYYLFQPSYRTVGANAQVDETLFGETQKRRSDDGKPKILIVGKDTVQIQRPVRAQNNVLNLFQNEFRVPMGAFNFLSKELRRQPQCWAPASSTD